MWYNSFGKVLAFTIFIFLLLAGLAFSLLVYSQYRSLTDTTDDQQTVTNTTVNSTVNTSVYVPDADDDPYLGPASAPVEIIAFEDFQCPYCEAEAPVLKQLVAAYPTEVKLVYRDFPLYTIHSYATAAAEAGECADAQGLFWQWHDQAYANQSDLPDAPAVFSTWATTAGLDVELFDACVAAGTYATEVQTDLNEGFLAGVSGTPTFFVNGTKVEGVLSLQQWKTVVDAAL